MNHRATGAVLQAVDGERWKVIPVEVPEGHYAVFNSISAYASDDVWVAGSYGNNRRIYPLLEHWDGHEWSIRSSPAPNPRFTSIQALAATGANDLWAVGTLGGADSVALVEHWDAKTWQVFDDVSSGGGNDLLFDTSSLGSKNVTAVGAVVFGEDFVIHWNGRRWTVQ